MTTGSPASSGVDQLGRGHDAGHGSVAGAGVGHDATARGGDREQGRLVVGAGPVQRGELAQAVPGGGHALDAEQPQQPQPGHRGGGDSRLGRRGVGQARPAGQRVIAVELLDHLEAPADRAAVVAPPGTLAGEQEADPGLAAALPRKTPPSGSSADRAPLSSSISSLPSCCSACSGLLTTTAALIGRSARPASSVPARSPSSAKDIRGAMAASWLIRPRRSAMLLASISSSSQSCLERTSCWTSGGDLGPALAVGLLEDDVGVDAAEAHRGHPGPDRPVSRPQLGRAGHPQRRPVAEQLRVRIDVAGRRRDHLVVDGQDGLEQPADTGRRLGVADVALQRADRGRCGVRVGLPPGRRRTPAVRWRRRRRCRCRGPRGS